MIVRENPQLHRDHEVRTGRLVLNGVEVGRVVSKGYDGSWTFGEFMPSEGFSAFASIFGRWSLLMHAEGIGERLSTAASEELRETETAIDSLRAAIIMDQSQARHAVREINIDGSLIEWKEV